MPMLVRAEDTRRLTLDEALGYAGGIDQYGAIPRLRWLHSQAPGEAPAMVETRFEADGTMLYRVDAKTGVTTLLFDPNALEAALAALPGMDKDVATNSARNASALRLDDSDRHALLEINGDLYAYDLFTKRAARVTDAPLIHRTDSTIAPDGAHVAYVSGNDLYIAAVHYDTGAPTPPRRVTSDGSARILNGRLDWVYEEEVYGRGVTASYHWSPDGKRLAFLRIDDSAVPAIPIVDDLPRLPVTDDELYPKAGDPNPVAMLGLVSVTDESLPTVWTDLAAYPDTDRLIVRFGFTPDSGRALIQVQNRIQTHLDLLAIDPATGKTNRLLQETTPAWVDVMDEPRFLSDGTFLWRSARTGFRHLYHYHADGTLIAPVTAGNWDVLDTLAVDEKNGDIYFSGNKDGATDLQVYRARVDGTNADKPTRLTTRAGTHDTDFDPTATLFLDHWSDLDDPTQLHLHSAKTGDEIRPLGANLLPLTTRRGYKLSEPELLTIHARDGYPLDALILKPTDFDPHKKYPIVYCLYGGPETPTVQDRWGTVALWHQYLAQQGFIVFMCDNRSASGRGMRNVWGIYKHLGESEQRDIEDAIGYLRQLRYADTKRIGVYGWSYGGFMVEYLLTHSNLFKVGVAGAGVADWRLYDTIYTERFMDTPQANPMGYFSTAPVNAANKLSGKLLLIHGTMDDNVHLQNTIEMIYALERSDESFDMMLYPRSRHGISDPALSRHMRSLYIKYLLDNL